MNGQGSDSNDRWRIRRTEAVVFDLFHTLVDPEEHRPKGFRRAHKIAELLGLEGVGAFALWWDEKERERHVSKSKRVAAFADDYLWEKVGRHCSDEETTRIDLICGQLQDKALANPRPDVICALQDLRRRGLRLDLLSNIDEREQVTWNQSPLSPLFDAACFSCEIGYSKPSREAYSVVLDKVRAEASESVFVGDGGHGELRGAREAGFGLVVFMRGFVSENGIRTPLEVEALKGFADATIDDLDELPSALDSFEKRRCARSSV